MHRTPPLLNRDHHETGLVQGIEECRDAAQGRTRGIKKPRTQVGPWLNKRFEAPATRAGRGTGALDGR
jgi:hypothetical protein